MIIMQSRIKEWQKKIVVTRMMRISRTWNSWLSFRFDRANAR